MLETITTARLDMHSKGCAYAHRQAEAGQNEIAHLAIRLVGTSSGTGILEEVWQALGHNLSD